MATAADGKLGGPFEIEESVLVRDAMIREDNDGDRIVDAAVIEYVKKNKKRIFALQTSFYDELKAKHNQLD